MNKVAKNAVWIIGGKVAQSVLALIINMLTARYLGPSNFGLITYASSLVAFVLPIMQLGFSNVLVQEIVNKPDQEGSILGTAMTLSLVSSIFCVIGVTSFAFAVNSDESETIIVCFLYSLILFFQALDHIEYWYQANLLSKYTSLVSLVAFSWKLGKNMFAKSKHYILSSMMVTIFAQTDKIMIKMMMDESSTGYYGAAVACAGMTSFVFAAIIDSFRPSIFEGQKFGEKTFKYRLTMLYSMIIYLSLFQSIGMTILSRIIIYVLYGEAYLLAVGALRIVVWYTTFSYIGSVRNIWILANEKQKYLWQINLSGAIANVVLNAILIPCFGIAGAAIASLITQFFTNVIVGYLIKSIRPNNEVIME